MSEQNCGTCKHMGSECFDGTHLCCAPVPLSVLRNLVGVDWVVTDDFGADCDAWEARA